ncbi:cutinase family protein [Microbacterium testaceum]|uniref:cutinase family protein n=1 Tax=Microbacterium testaceum TaxID=2033 RepID=UPI0025B17DB9|nr:cutinase family protein [Microbacterium testaceum]WJS91114.1 cutinase family protein [Microbacterium testaceum]
MAIIVGGGAAATPAQALPPSNPCDAWMVMIGVRGTGAPAGSNPGPGGRVWRSGGMGDFVTSIANGVDTNAPDALQGMYRVSLNYPATATVNPIDSSGAYINSRNAGVAALKAELQYYASCARPPSVTLIGYSQGADVIGTALGQVSQSIRSRVQAAVLLGDPSYRANQPINAPGLNPGGSGMFSQTRTDAIQNALNGMTSYGWNADTQSMGTRQHVREYCLYGDAACQNQIATGWNIHGQYGAWVNAATNYINNVVLDIG